MERLRKGIAKEIDRQGVAYAEVGRRVGVSRQAIWNTLNNESTPRIETLTKIANAIGLDVTIHLEAIADRGTRITGD